jgi:hypothetical protein
MPRLVTVRLIVVSLEEAKVVAEKLHDVIGPMAR